jgi:hypothetical protein
MPKRLSAMLAARNRRAVTASKLSLAQGVKDEPLLRALAAKFNGREDWVLVTGDDSMPAEHGEAIIETEATVAVIHPHRPPDMIQHEWRIDITQRWAHAMQDQDPQTVRRYNAHGSKVWTPRRRHLLDIAREGWIPWTPETDDGKREPPPKPEPPPPRLPGLE